MKIRFNELKLDCVSVGLGIIVSSPSYSAQHPIIDYIQKMEDLFPFINGVTL